MSLKGIVALLLFISCSITSTYLVSRTMQQRPVAIRLGHLPATGLLKLVSADFQPLIAQFAVTKVMFYYGSLIDDRFNRSGDRPEYYQMFKTLEKAIQLDPYNMDPYYFAQATYTWGLNRAADVNRLLIHGMKYRDWDYWLPFYVGFNASYFLHDADTAAKYFQRAAEISGNQTYASLASRAYYLTGRSDLAITFLETLWQDAKDDLTRQMYAKRLQALRAVNDIQRAIARYYATLKVRPQTIDELLTLGYLDALPVDPYGGTFYLDKSGNVLTTSRLYEQPQTEKAE